MRRLVLLLLSFLSFSAMGKDLTARLGQWEIRYNQTRRVISVKMARRIVLDNVSPEARYHVASGEEKYITFAQATKVRMKRGKGSVLLSCADSDGVELEESFSLQDSVLLVKATLRSPRADIQSRYLSPVFIAEPYTLFPASAENRMLKVPYDNDDFVRYHQYPFGSEMTSFEVAAFHAGAQRTGLIIGSVDHDHWKSGITAKSDPSGRICQLNAFSGISHRETRDVLPHGALVGREISSARFFVGFFPDWRDGMEAFADANTRVVPGRRSWTRGAPFGWQSWGVMAEKNSFSVDKAVSQYFADELMPAGFHNDQGYTVMSIDAWDNLNDDQKRELCQLCKARHQIPGTYWTPFCLWWDEKRILEQKLPGQDKYLAHECILRANGEFLRYDGAYCLDPTHPGVKAWIDAEIGKIKRLGFEYLKVDFTDNGMIQADSYYNPAVRTAVEAYNEGFTHFCRVADEGTPLFVALSIAPIFPYQYGNSRRIACDTWGRISHSEYCMNAIGGGWWTGRLYQYNDPDHCPLIGRDDAVGTTEAENRARYTTLMCAGMALVCDNYDLDDQSGRGDARLSRERARLIMMNPEINAIGQLGKSFRPIYGYRQFEGKDSGAESFFQLDADGCSYVAVINYSSAPLRGELPLERLGLTSIRSLRELWTQQNLPVPSDKIIFDVPARDARLFRLATGHHDQSF